MDVDYSAEDLPNVVLRVLLVASICETMDFIFRRILRYWICWNLSEIFIICSNLSKFFIICSNLSEFLIICSNLSEFFVKICSNLSDFFFLCCLNMSKLWIHFVKMLKLSVIFTFVWVANAIPIQKFYQFGVEHGDAELPRIFHESSSPEISLTVPVKYYGESYSSVFVSAFTYIDKNEGFSNFGAFQISI